MKSLIAYMMVLVTCFCSFALWAEYDRLQLNDSESTFCHAPIVVEGKVLSIKSEPSHYTIGASSSYSYKLKFLVENVLKGDPKYKNKEITIATYFQPGFFDYYNKHPRFTTALTEIDDNLLATPLRYDLVTFRSSSLRQKLLNGNKDCAEFHVIPLDELIKFESPRVLSSEFIILGFVSHEEIIDGKFSFSSYFESPYITADQYHLYKFQIQKVIKGNKALEGTAMNFVQPLYRTGVEDICSFLRKGVVLMLGAKNIPIINSKTDPRYLGPEGYKICESDNFMFNPEDEPAIRMFLKNANSATVTATGTVTK